jgi:hypothetical protein
VSLGTFGSHILLLSLEDVYRPTFLRVSPYLSCGYCPAFMGSL